MPSSRSKQSRVGTMCWLRATLYTDSAPSTLPDAAKGSSSCIAERAAFVFACKSASSAGV
eukprot:21013-Heterococcus_DN1.PRE.3